MTDRPLRILHFIPSLSFRSGGIGRYMQLLAKELGRQVRLTIITYASCDELPIDNARVIYIPLLTITGKRCRHIFEYALDTVQPDLVHTHGCWLPVDAMTLLWAKKKGYPVVCTPHGMLEPYIRRRHYWSRKLPAWLLYQRRALQRVDALVATAEEERRNILNFRPKNRVEVVPIGLDTDTITMKKSWQRTGKIVFLSRIHEKKGIDFLLQAAADMKEELNGYTIYIYGMGDEAYTDLLRQQAQQLGVADKVVFAGSVQGDDKWRALREADLFVLPTHSENFGIAVAEALASGTPVVTTKGTPWQEIETHHCGWWTEIGTEPTKEALRSFIDKSETELEEMGRNGRRLIEEHYSTTNMAQQMMQVYTDVMEKTRQTTL